jgi:urease accessory protein
MTPACLARRAAVPALLMLSGLACAHTGHDHAATADFAAGLAHPASGVDHLLAMVAVGLWGAAALPASRRWAAPAAFVAAMTIGAFAAATLAVPFGGSLEVLIAASVLALGAMLALGSGVVPAAGLALTAAAGVLHGAAHGLEMSAGASFGAYALGFVLATAALHGAGLGIGSWLVRARAVLLRHAGALIGVAGAVMLAARL